MAAEKNGDTFNPKAYIDFQCMENDCEGIIKFDLVEMSRENPQIMCRECHKPYMFDKKLRDKLESLYNLILAIREAEDILGDCNVAVTVPGGEVKVPYALLLTRLNTMISLNVGDKTVDFHLRVEPSSPETFR